MPESMSIDALPLARRRERWREAVSETFVSLDCRLSARAPRPHGTLRADAFGALRAARVTSCAQSVRRTEQHARAATEAWVLASVQLAGRTVVAQAGREAVLRAGDVAFYDTARPYSLLLPDDFDQMVLYLPRDAVEAAVPDGLDSMATRLPAAHPCARALHALAPWLLDHELGPGANAMAGTLRCGAADGAATLFTLALDSLAHGATSTERRGDTHAAHSLHWRAQASIEHHLDDPSFDAPALAARLGVSPRRLQEVHAAAGTTPTRALRDARLERARAWLACAELRHEPIARIAARVGFDDPAGFSRRFRARFGCTPRECRAAALA